MSTEITEIEAQGMAPGAHVRTQGTRRSYLIGLSYAVILTLASFWASSTDVVYPLASPFCWGFSRLLRWGFTWCSSAHLERAGPDQQYSRARLWHFRCGSPGIRIDDHHGSFEPQHDAMDRLMQMPTLALQPKASMSQALY